MLVGNITAFKTRSKRMNAFDQSGWLLITDDAIWAGTACVPMP